MRITLLHKRFTVDTVNFQHFTTIMDYLSFVGTRISVLEFVMLDMNVSYVKIQKCLNIALLNES